MDVTISIFIALKACDVSPNLNSSAKNKLFCSAYFYWRKPRKFAASQNKVCSDEPWCIQVAHALLNMQIKTRYLSCITILYNESVWGKETCDSEAAQVMQMIKQDIWAQVYTSLKILWRNQNAIPGFPRTTWSKVPDIEVHFHRE